MSEVMCKHCGRPARYPKLALCGAHYWRMKAGKPMGDPLRIVGDFERRFWSKVAGIDPLGCWLWTASLNDAGYGQFMVDGIPRRAHRIAYELLIADIPEGLTLDHLCRVRGCVNPWHLDPVPNEVNIERGEFGTKQAPLKTHCPSGHPYEGDNVRIRPDGSRQCRACEKRHSLAAYYRRKARGEAIA